MAFSSRDICLPGGGLGNAGRDELQRAMHPSPFNGLAEGVDGVLKAVIKI